MNSKNEAVNIVQGRKSTKRKLEYRNGNKAKRMSKARKS